MPSPLTQGEAKRRILDAFPPESNPTKFFDNNSEQYYLETLNAVYDAIPFQDEVQEQSLKLFLFAGCLRFERWFAPSPYVVAADLGLKFDQFLHALIEVEGGSSGNTAIFELHRVRNKAYAQFDERPIAAVSDEQLEDLRQELQQIGMPVQPAKKSEVQEHLDEFVAMLSGMKDRTLRTRIKTRLPYVLHRASLSLSFQWKGIAVDMNLTPTFQLSNETFANAAPNAMAVGANRWQAGTTTVDMQLAALIDGDRYTESLQAIEGQDTPVFGWPKCFTLAFSIIHEVSWQVRILYGGEQQWVPAPRDLSDIELSFQTSTRDGIGWKLKSSPANLIESSANQDEVLDIQLGELTTLNWSAKCRSLASMYLELGETNEALFWLNVATEALFKERFAEIATQLDRPDFEAELDSPKAFWAPAEEIVSEQFPDVAGRIQWPETGIHVSIYAKLKYLYRNVKMKTTIKQLLRHYRTISKHRNALFHGVLEDRVSLDKVQQAFTDYDWIATNMRPAKPEVS